MQLIRKAEPRRLDILESSQSYVTSSLMMSQLAGGLFLYINAIVKAHYPNQIQKIMDLEFNQVLSNEFTEKVQVKHVKDIHHWLKPGGHAYFSCTKEEKKLIKAAKKTLSVPHTPRRIMIFPAPFEQIEASFETIDEKNWDWVQGAKESNGRAFEIFSTIVSKNV